MKRKKNPNHFKFKDKTNEEMVEIVNSCLPIKLSKVEYLVDKIHERYPVASKTEIAMVVRSVFESIREFFILGYVINFNRLFFDTKLHFFKRSNFTAVKIQSKTPPPLKKHENN